MNIFWAFSMIVPLYSLKYCVNTIVYDYDNHAAPWTISKYYGITIWYPPCAIVPSHLLCVKSCSLWNPLNSVKIGTLCWSLWHNYPMNTKHHWQKWGLVWKLPLRKCSMGVVTLTLYRGRVPLSREEQGKGQTNGQHTDPVKRRTQSTWVQWDTHSHTYMHAHATIPAPSCWVLCGHAQKLFLTGLTPFSPVHMVMCARKQMEEIDFLFWMCGWNTIWLSIWYLFTNEASVLSKIKNKETANYTNFSL